MPGSWEDDGARLDGTFSPDVRIMYSEFEDHNDHLRMSLARLEYFCPNWLREAPTPAIVVISEATGNRVRFELARRYYRGENLPNTTVWVYVMVTPMINPCRVSEILVYAKYSPLAYGLAIKNIEWEAR